MLKSLNAKLVAVFLVLIICLGLFFAWLNLTTTEGYFHEVNQRLNRDLASKLVQKWALLRDGDVESDRLKEVFSTLMVANPTIELYLIDTEGDILAYDAPPEKIVRNAVSLEPVEQFLASKQSFPLLGDDPRDADGQKVFSVAPIRSDMGLEGYLYIILGGEDYDSVLEMIGGSFVVRMSFWIVLASMTAVLLVGVFSFSLLTRRLRSLTAAVNSFRTSEFTRLDSLQEPPHMLPGDEIDQLSDTFRRMARRIIGHIEQLKQVDTDRREMVGSVSHDLRAPLTNLQGHLETLLMKEESLDTRERERFLQMAIGNCKRLNRLVDSLFQLAVLDSVDYVPEFDTFSLDELLLDVVQKYHEQAEKKEIHVDTSDISEPVQIEADIELIERMLDNLLANAIKYSDSGDTVSVSMTRQNGSVQISVQDTGIGIPEEELERIFEKFYRSAGSGRVDGSGLGLPIVKRIVQLHQGDVSATSSNSRGSTFVVNLPLNQS